MRVTTLALMIMMLFSAGCVQPDQPDHPETPEEVTPTPTPTLAPTATPTPSPTPTPAATPTPTRNVTRGWQTGGSGSGGGSGSAPKSPPPEPAEVMLIVPESQEINVGESGNYTISIKTKAVNETHFIAFDTHCNTLHAMFVGYCNQHNRTGCVSWKPMNESVWYNFTLNVRPVSGVEINKNYTITIVDNEINAKAHAQVEATAIPIPEVSTFLMVLIGTVVIGAIRRRRVK